MLTGFGELMTARGERHAGPRWLLADQRSAHHGPPRWRTNTGGHCTLAAREADRGRGFDGYLRKPVDPNELCNTVQALARARRPSIAYGLLGRLILDSPGTRFWSTFCGLRRRLHERDSRRNPWASGR
jgi:hypothetical protein